MLKFSIVSPSFNQAAFLDDMLRSVRQQGYAELEHIVMDGGSTDGSVEILRAAEQMDTSCLRWESKPDGGQSDALNQGFRQAQGDIVGWLNSDDRYHDGCLKEVARAFEENPDVDVIYGDYAVIDAAGLHLRTRREIEFSRLILVHHASLYVSSTCTFFRRRIFDEKNFLDETLHYAMDHEFFARLAMLGYRFKHVRVVLADFRLHGASKTCVRPAQQLVESNVVMHRYSPVVRWVENRALRSICLRAVRLGAAFLRYSEKLLRGYYLREGSDWRLLVPFLPARTLSTSTKDAGDL